MKEKTLIAALAASREAFDRAAPLIDKHTFSDLSLELYEQIRKFYKADKNAESVDWALVLQRIKRRFPKKVDIFKSYIGTLDNDVSVGNVVELLREARREAIGFDLVAALESGKEVEAMDLMREYMADLVPEENVAREYCNLAPSELHTLLSGDKLPVWPRELNEAIGGGLARGSQIAIFGRPNAGKTTLTTMVVGHLAYKGLRVLYLWNEDPKEKLLPRFIQYLARCTEQTLYEQEREMLEKAQAKGYGNITAVELGMNTLDEIEAAIRKHKPDVVVVDQIRNITTKLGAREGMTINLQELAIAMRRLAKNNNFLSILVTQAGDSAEGKLVLEATDIEWSNTGFQAQMDLMLGIGVSDTFARQGKRMLSMPRWKYGPPIDPMVLRADFAAQRFKVKV